MKRRDLLVGGLAAMAGGLAQANAPFYRLPLTRSIDAVQPYTGIVLWSDHEKAGSDAIQLEFSYLRYDSVIKGRSRYDWTVVERLLDAVAARRHQAILRFWEAYPGYRSSLPAYLKAWPGYAETHGRSEGKPTSFPDWSHPELKRLMLEFYTAFARRYDADPRLAYLQLGFGLWSEYHIYDGPLILGKTFPDKAFQAEFARTLANAFTQLPWMISIDAANRSIAPFADSDNLLDLSFGVFDDSFLDKSHRQWNAPNWQAMGQSRWQVAPAGGEFSYGGRVQAGALSADGPYGSPFERMAAQFHISFMVGSDQPQYQPMSRLRSAGLACGYRIRVLALESNGRLLRVKATNTGIAPMYHDAYFAAGGVRAARSLKGLLPGQVATFELATPAASLRIDAPRLVSGQSIAFEADLPG